MPAADQDILCRYHYDPLDRLIGTTPTSAAGLQRFYCKSRLATEIQGAVQRSIFQEDNQLLAQQQIVAGITETSLMATDQQRSVLHLLGPNPPRPMAYSPYGHRSADSGLLSVLGFNGERPDPATGCYLLGNGYRAFNPVLMRFNSPDNLSPFGKGGLNPYAYCLGDPINRYDENGHFSLWQGLSGFQAAASKKIASLVTPVSKVKTPKIRTLTEPKGPGVKNNATEQFKNLHPGRLRKEHRARMELQKTDKDIIMKITSLDDITKLQSDRQYKFVMLSNDDIYVGGPTSLETGTALKHSVLSYAVQKPEVITAGMMRYSPDIGEGVVFLINKSGHHRSTESSLQYASKKLSSLGAEVRSNRRS